MDLIDKSRFGGFPQNVIKNNRQKVDYIPDFFSEVGDIIFTLFLRLIDSPSLNFLYYAEIQAIANAKIFPQSFPVSAKLWSCLFKIFVVKNQPKLKSNFARTSQNQSW